jgi:exosortase D (VPLPA-CTERM-specific)
MSAQLPGSSGVSLPIWRLPWTIALVGVAVGLLSLWPFWDGLSVMWSGWLGLPEYSHCLLLPPMALFLIWQQKDRLERIPFIGTWWGVALVLLGGAMLVMGQLGTVYTVVQYAYVVTLYGLILSFLGWAAFRHVAIPLVILLFMIPLPQFVLYNLSVQLQLLSSQIGVYVMRLFDISVFLEGNVIDLGGYKLQVADACSGLRYLFPLMTLGFLMAYFYKGAPWKRVVLFLSSIPITVLMNSLRVGIIGVTVEHWGIEMAEGFLHEFQGWAVFMICAALMLAEMVTLTSVGREAGTWRQLFGVDFPASTPRDALVRQRPVPKTFIVAASLLMAVVVAAAVLPRPAESIPQRTSFAEFPVTLGDWSGRRDSLEGVYLDQLKLDDYLMADYSNGIGRRINMYISYYNSQRKGEAVHSPRSCLPGGGWQLKGFGQRTLPQVTLEGRPLRVNRTVIELGNQRQLVYYWFQQRGRVVTNEFAVKWYLFWDALTRHRSDGAMVRLITVLQPGGDTAAADRDLVQFAALVAPELSRFVPN